MYPFSGLEYFIMNQNSRYMGKAPAHYLAFGL